MLMTNYHCTTRSKLFMNRLIIYFIISIPCPKIHPSKQRTHGVHAIYCNKHEAIPLLHFCATRCISMAEVMLTCPCYRKALIFRGLYISRINGKIRFREKYFRENRMKWYRGGDRWHITHAYIIKRIDLVQH